MSARDSWMQEKESVYLYGAMAVAEHAPERRKLFSDLATEAEAQAAIWAGEASRAGDPLPDPFVPRVRLRLIAQLVRLLGPVRMRAALAAMKVRGLSVYVASEHGHAMPVSVDDVGQRHRGAAGGNLRAAVFGVNDGLVSNASLIVGVAGATGLASSGGADGSGHAVLISGVAGLLAGAFSMASGEYVSVRSQREMFERQINAERDELAQYPAQEAAELSLIYQARGLPKDDADHLAERIVANPKYALDTLAREELGLDPGSLGSPWAAAVSSFFAFAAGALVPLLPFVVMGAASHAVLIASMGLTAAALLGVGATISLFTGRGAVRGGLRMLLIGAAAAAATFLIGRLLGVAVG
jgi:VIT1/CCC1 family predicted Fe2+/Mn2+ transporter